jgi:hypothetical protein
MMLNKMETQNILLANMLSNQLDPVNSKELRDRLVNIGRDPSAY